MKIQSFKSMLLLSVVVWGATGAIAFVVGKNLAMSAASSFKGLDGKALTQAEINKMLTQQHLYSTAPIKEGAPPSLQDLIAAKGKIDAGQLARWVGGLSPGEIASNLADVEKNLPPGSKRDAILAALADAWAKKDPNGFLANMDKVSSPKMKESGVMSALQSLATTDPKAALDWIAKNPGGAGNSRLDSVIQGYASTNPTEALAYINGMPNANRADQQVMAGAIQAMIAGMGSQGNYSDAVGMIAQLPTTPPNLQNQAMSGLMAQWAVDSPLDAAQYAASLGNPQMGQYDRTIATSWAQNDPAAAAAWAVQADAANAADPNQAAAGTAGGRRGAGGLGGPGGGNVLPTTISQWVADGDVDGAGTFLNTLPAGPDKDQAIARLATGAMAEDPATSMAWAATIGDPTTQLREEGTVASTWQQEDPQGYADYLATLTPAQAAALTAAAGNAGFNRGGGNGFQGGAPGGVPGGAAAAPGGRRNGGQAAANPAAPGVTPGVPGVAATGRRGAAIGGTGAGGRRGAGGAGGGAGGGG